MAIFSLELLQFLGYIEQRGSILYFDLEAPLHIYNDVLTAKPDLCLVKNRAFLNGTTSLFYKIPITQELVTAVEKGNFPEHTTHVLEHWPTKSLIHAWDAMNTVENQGPLVKHYLLFKEEAQEMWAKFAVQDFVIIKINVCKY